MPRFPCVLLIDRQLAMADSEGSWRLDGSLGRFTSRALSCEIDIKDPSRGLSLVTLQGALLDGTFLSVSRHSAASWSTQQAVTDWPAALGDAYVRGADLVGAYLATDQWPYAPQIYWRAHTVDDVPGVLDSLGILISVETHLLDTHPEIDVKTRLAAEEVLEIQLPKAPQSHGIRIDDRPAKRSSSESRCILWRLANPDVSYTEIMPASDFRDVTIERHNDGTSSARWSVFADFLEKGVIRRARLQSAFVARRDDVRTAAACYNALKQRPLPLTV